MLNETLPPYMTRNYTLAPFQPTIDDSTSIGSRGNWTGETTMYSLDMSCVPSSPIRNAASRSGTVLYKTNGCNVTLGLTGNLTQGYNTRDDAPILSVKQYTGMHIGYWNFNGFADYYLSSQCPPERNATFYAAFARSKQRDEDPPNDVTAIFCEPKYYQRKVNATVDRVTRRPLQIIPLDEKQSLNKDIFNATHWEAQMVSGSSGYDVRDGDMPGVGTPTYLDYIAQTNVSIGTGSQGGGLVQRMVGLSLAVSDLPLEDYLDWKVLSKSYADAYRVIFSRTMVDILGDDYTSALEISGQHQYTTEAVVLEPVFVYIVEGLLGAISLATIVLLYLSVTRRRRLRTDPNTIASIMSLVADNKLLLSEFENLDCCTSSGVQNALGHKRFRLLHDDDRTGIEILASGLDPVYKESENDGHPQHSNTTREIAKPIRPKEFRLGTAVPFVGLFIALSAALAIIYVRAQGDGLPLPSTVSLVQNILENYIPTALATLIEPMWVMINRLLCMLQPIEQLRSCKAKAKDSIDLNYSSLPPQLTVFKALRARHFVLAMVCAMALLSNLLAVAFAGIFNQDNTSVRRIATFEPSFDMKFVSIDGNIGPKTSDTFGALKPSGAYRGGSSQDHWLIAESNFTRDTPLPAWTDERMFYLPYRASDQTTPLNEDVQYEAETTAFGAKLDCEVMRYGADYWAEIRNRGKLGGLEWEFNTTVRQDARIGGCPASLTGIPNYGPIRPELTKVEDRCQSGPSSMELSLLKGAATNTTQSVKDACMNSVILGWIRAPDGSCGQFKNRNLTAENSLFVRCRPKFVVGRATVRVDGRGRLQKKVDNFAVSEASASELSRMFSNDPVNLAGQSNLYMWKTSGNTFHNDSRAVDFLNYFATREANSTRLLDPNAPVPTLEDVEATLGLAYSRLFAIWVGANKENLLMPRSSQSPEPVQGWTVKTERRVFLSTPMFIISESILAIYTIVAIVVYLRRPGRYLAQMPTSIAAVISLFAASAAVQDMRRTSHLDSKGRAEHLKLLDSRYGYGSYVGGDDGRVHIGIEKTPFVRVRSKSTWFDQMVRSSRKASAV